MAESPAARAEDMEPLEDATSESDDDATREPVPDALYDPEADEKDLVWAHGKRRGRVSDAILSCPCCFTTLCIDCQRHDTKQDQYRAMFTLNCTVKSEAARAMPSNNARKRGKKRVAIEPTAGGGEVVHPVHCAVCDTEVGVQDADEVVHFNNIVPSNA
jgi:hypothetical protein